MFRVEKTNKDKDDLKVMGVGAVCTLIILFMSLSFPRITEYRWYRDFSGLTPFNSVELNYTILNKTKNEIVIGGFMIKKRCTFKSLSGYIIDQHGNHYRVRVDDSVEASKDIEKNRPPSKYQQSWGPWSLRVQRELMYEPVEFKVFARHIECPTEPFIQSNLFVKGKWKTKN